VRIAGGTVALILGAIVLSEVSDAWVIFGAFLVVAAAVNVLVAILELTIAHPRSAQA
jgi:hypothetical protein